MPGALPAPPFAHGVASFDPLADRILLWTCVRDPVGQALTAPVRWVVEDAPEGGRTLAEGTATPAAETGIVTVDVVGLPAATTLWYRFEAPGGTSPTGRARTLPDGPVDGLRLAVTCCSDLSKGPLDAYRVLAERDLDLVVHLGDYLYADSGAGTRPVAPGHDTITLQDYRDRFAAYRRDGDLQAVHQAHPWVATWDDHDLADNAWRGGAKGHDPETQGPWAARARAAAQARQEWLPTRAGMGGRPDLLWRSIPLGDLAELVVLDARWWGRAQDPDGGDLDDPARDLLGADQWTWFEGRMADATTPRRWALVCSSVVVNDLTVPVPGARLAKRWASGGWGVHGDRLVRVDEWDGFPAARQRLARALAGATSAPVVLAGDVHASMAFEGPPGADGEPTAVELVAPPVLSTPMGRVIPAGGRALSLAVPEAKAGLRWCDLVAYGFLLLDVRPAQLQASWWSVEPGSSRPPRALGAWRTDPGRRGHLEAVPPPPLDVVAPPFAPDLLVLPPRPTGVPSQARRRRRLRLGALALAGAAVAVLRRRRRVSR